MNDGKIKIRVDEWVSKVETTPEGTFIYIDEDIKEEVLAELGKKLSNTPKSPFIIVDGEMVWSDEDDEGGDCFGE